MKKEFSFYEFAGIIVPSSILLFSINYIVDIVYQKSFFDFGKMGESVIFLLICYGFGHILQGLGNFYEAFVWFIFQGVPSKWLNKENRFHNSLFDEQLNTLVLDKVKSRFGDDINDYGRLTYNLLFQQDKTKRIDIFNGNYSLFRGLAVSFFIISILCLYYFHWAFSLFFILAFLISTIRMIRFAKYYATEIFRTFYNIET